MHKELTCRTYAEERQVMFAQLQKTGQVEVSVKKSVEKVEG